MMRTLPLIVFLLVAPGAMAEESDLETLYDWMTGSFGSAAQAAEDPDYYHITLEMAPIWSERAGEHWFYVEQAVAEARDEPYRQRVYRVREHPDGLIESAVYLLPEPTQAVGAWKVENALADLSPEDLELREGCSVFMRRMGDDRFEGETRDKACASSLRGAAYATSGVVVTSARIESWDRGFDTNGQQVWGAEKGPYLFERE